MNPAKRLPRIAIDQDDVEWKAWPEGQGVDPEQVRWKPALSSDRTASHAITMGVAEIAAGGTLPRHRHKPPEFYHGLTGTGEVETDHGLQVLQPGSAIHLPSNAWHLTWNVGGGPLTFLFMFPGG